MTGLLLLQIAVILVVARLCGLLLARLGQPPVIGEMAAGLLLGPVVFGAALPDVENALFWAAILLLGGFAFALYRMTRSAGMPAE